MRPLHRFRAEHGFTIVEVMVAALVLAVGIAGTLGLIMASNSATAASTDTEGGTNLAREVIERVRELPITQITPAGLVTSLQALPGLGNTNQGAPGTWTVTRRNRTYTITVDVCAIDDPKDGSGSHAGATFCSSGGGASGTADSSPQDYLRVTADISWKPKGSAVRHTKQVELISGHGADGPATTDLIANPSPGGAANRPVVSSSATTSVSFRATVASTAQKVNVLVNGSTPDPTVGPATATFDGNYWNFTLNVSNMPDGSYEVAVQAEDANGTQGQLFFIPLLLNRGAVPAPTGVVGGLNTVFESGVLTPVAEIAWDGSNCDPISGVCTSSDAVLGYHVYRPDHSLACTIDLSADPQWTTSCKDDSPQDGFYTVAAIYQDASGAQLDSPETPTAAPIIASPVRTWWFDNHHNYRNAPAPPCNTGGVKDFDLTENGPAVGAGHQNAGGGADNHRFCGAALTSDFTMPARKVIVSLSMKNGSGATNCPGLTVTVSIGSFTTGPQTKTITAATGIRPVTFTWTLPSPVTLNAGDQPRIDLNYDPSPLCDTFEEDFNKDTTPSTLNIPTSAYPEPNKPTNVTSTTDSNGTTLSWNAPTGTGLAVDHYNIYRDGYNYDNRVDVTDDASNICTAASPSVCTWTDPDPVTGSHTYYVTAVSANQQESDPVPLAPATFP